MGLYEQMNELKYQYEEKWEKSEAWQNGMRDYGDDNWQGEKLYNKDSLEYAQYMHGWYEAFQRD